MADIRRVKVLVSGYYDIDMSRAEEDYETTDPGEMLAIDTKGLTDLLEYSEIHGFLDGSVKVALSWEN
jgi:hypothetical protein